MSDIPNLPEFQLIRFKPERPRLAQTLTFLWFGTKRTQAFADFVLGRAGSILTGSQPCWDFPLYLQLRLLRSLEAVEPALSLGV